MSAEPVSDFTAPEPLDDSPAAPATNPLEEVAQPETPRDSRFDMIRRWWPAAAATAAWIGFGWAWIVIFIDRASTVSPGGPGLLGLYAVVMLTATLVWRAYNRRLHARLGARRRIPRVRESWRVDHCGRVLRAEWADVRAARVVDVEIEDGVKSFRPGAST
jgi:hypothetical protein